LILTIALKMMLATCKSAKMSSGQQHTNATCLNGCHQGVLLMQLLSVEPVRRQHHICKIGVQNTDEQHFSNNNSQHCTKTYFVNTKTTKRLQHELH